MIKKIPIKYKEAKSQIVTVEPVIGDLARIGSKKFKKIEFVKINEPKIAVCTWDKL